MNVQTQFEDEKEHPQIRKVSASIQVDEQNQVIKLFHANKPDQVNESIRADEQSRVDEPTGTDESKQEERSRVQTVAQVQQTRSEVPDDSKVADESGDEDGEAREINASSMGNVNGPEEVKSRQEDLQNNHESVVTENLNTDDNIRDGE